MGSRTTTAGKAKVSVALDPHAYELLKRMAVSPRRVGAVLDDLIMAAAERSSGPTVDHVYALILENIDDAVVATDREHHITVWNTAAERIYGWTRDEVLGQGYQFLSAAVGRAELDSALATLDATGALRCEGRQLRKDGTPIHVAVNALALHGEGGATTGFLAVLRDVTRRKRAEQTLAAHAARLQVVHEIDLAILAARSPAEIAQVAAERVRRAIGADRVNVATWEPDGASLEVVAAAGAEDLLLPAGAKVPMRAWAWVEAARKGQIAFEEDLALTPNPSPETLSALAHGTRSHAVIPLLVAGQPIGHLAIARREAGRLPDEHLALVRQVADSLAVAMHHARLDTEVQERRAQLQVLSRRLVELQEQERRALSRDLHDTSGQSITALKLNLSVLKRTTDLPDAARSRVDDLLTTADRVAEDLHRLAVNLRPSSLDRYGLVPALEQLLTEFRRQTGVEVDFSARGRTGPFVRLPGDVETVLYRVVQEALTNAARHAQAGIVAVLLLADDDQVNVIVEDNGRGFDVVEAMRSGRLGLLGMRERAEMLGGTLEIESRPGAGTIVHAAVPLSPAPATGGSGADELLAGLPVSSGVVPMAEEHDVDAGLAEAAERARVMELNAALSAISAAMAGCLDADATLEMLLARATEALGFEVGHIAIRENDLWDMRYAYHETPEPRQLTDTQAPAFEYVARTRQTLAVCDTGRPEIDARLRLEPYRVKSFACAPLLAGDRLLGVLGFVNFSATRDFHPSELDFLNRAAALVTLALEEAALRRSHEALEEMVAARTAELALQAGRMAILQEIDRTVLEARSPAEVARAVLGKVQLAMQVERVSVLLLDQVSETVEFVAASNTLARTNVEGTRWPMSRLWNLDRLQAGQVATVPAVAELPDDDPWKQELVLRGIQSVTLLPLVAREKVIGLLWISRKHTGNLAPELLGFAAHVADSLALAIQNARLLAEVQASRSQLQALSRRLVDVQERERRYVAERLYNEAGQGLAALKVRLALLDWDGRGGIVAAEQMAEVRATLDRVLREVHELASQLRPASLDHLGLAAALKQVLADVAAAHGFEPQFASARLDGVRIPAEVETGLYRIAQEALSNIALHARASLVGLGLMRSDRTVSLIVEDDGVGFDVASALARGALGLIGMRERARLLGGQMVIESTPERGTSIIVEVPLDESR